MTARYENQPRLSNRRRDENDDVQERRRDISTTTKMSAPDAEWSVDSATEAIVNELDDILSLKEDQTTSLKAFAEKKD